MCTCQLSTVASAANLGKLPKNCHWWAVAGRAQKNESHDSSLSFARSPTSTLALAIGLQGRRRRRAARQPAPPARLKPLLSPARSLRGPQPLLRPGHSFPACSPRGPQPLLRLGRWPRHPTPPRRSLLGPSPRLSSHPLSVFSVLFWEADFGGSFSKADFGELMPIVLSIGRLRDGYFAAAEGYVHYFVSA
ncbi:uncharacterized protein LOC119358009 [Triticum dicoccoides]|uniref:uncharacterized protein LOC119358009 n=1 Tax=Triticum dicoccoides TaxID=85692 RepID=UPI00188FD6C5|nr:uncharacterized protein LOC119358009 [Triticum dicoccoides]